MPRTPHRVAIVVFCEAEGIDERDAAVAAQMAVSHALRQAGTSDPLAQAKVASTREPSCQRCGARAGVGDDQRVAKHVAGEPFFPDPDPLAPDWRPDPCPGTGMQPQADTQPVVGFDRPDRLPTYARVHEVMDVGMALGNGYLWAHTTTRAYRY